MEVLIVVPVLGLGVAARVLLGKLFYRAGQQLATGERGARPPNWMRTLGPVALAVPLSLLAYVLADSAEWGKAAISAGLLALVAAWWWRGREAGGEP